MMEHPAALTEEQIAAILTKPNRTTEYPIAYQMAQEVQYAQLRKALRWANQVMMTDGDTNLEALLDKPWNND